MPQAILPEVPAGKLLFRVCLLCHESSRHGPELPRRQSAFGPNERTNVVRACAVQLGPARLTDCPASKSDSASRSVAAFERASKPCHPPVPAEDTYRLRLTQVGGVEGPDPTRPEVLADSIEPGRSGRVCAPAPSVPPQRQGHRPHSSPGSVTLVWISMDLYRYLKGEISIFSFLDIYIDLWISIYGYPGMDIHTKISSEISMSNI